MDQYHRPRGALKPGSRKGQNMYKGRGFGIVHFVIKSDCKEMHEKLDEAEIKQKELIKISIPLLGANLPA